MAAALLIGTVLAVAGAFSRGEVAHYSYFKSAGGLVPGATVRYGGMKAGRVEAVRVDPQDPTRIEIDFSVGREVPVKTDSVAKITSLGALDENYVELGTGTKGAPLTVHTEYGIRFRVTQTASSVTSTSLRFHRL
jgi:phospholipid/cholesterol/gamma-HCH transport system substrate-binding protein